MYNTIFHHDVLLMKLKKLNCARLFKFRFVMTDLFFFSFFFFFLGGVPLFASTEAAMSAWDKSYNDFYKAILPLKHPSEEELKKLYSKIVQPALQEYMQEKNDDYLKNYPLNQGKNSGKSARGKHSNPSKAAGKVSGGTSGPVTPQFQPTRREEVVLEGEGIPKEIEFTGKKKDVKKVVPIGNALHKSISPGLKAQ